MPRSRAYAYLADPRNRPAWQASLKRVEMLDDGPPRVGTRWVDHLYGGPSFSLEIVAMETDRLWAERGRTGPVTAAVTLLFDDEGATGTRIRVLTRVTGTGLRAPLGWVATAALTLLVRVDVPRIRRVLVASA